MRNVLLLTYASTAGGYATVTKGLNVGCIAVTGGENFPCGAGWDEDMQFCVSRVEL